MGIQIIEKGISSGLKDLISKLDLNKKKLWYLYVDSLDNKQIISLNELIKEFPESFVAISESLEGEK